MQKEFMVGELSGRGNVLSGKYLRVGKCPSGKFPIEKLLVGNLASGKCQSQNCPVTKQSYNLRS